MASEIGESADVVSRTVRNRRGMAEIAKRLRLHSAPLCVLCGRGSSGHAGVFLRYLIETRLGLPVSASAPSVTTAFRTPLILPGIGLRHVSRAPGITRYDRGLV